VRHGVDRARCERHSVCEASQRKRFDELNMRRGVEKYAASVVPARAVSTRALLAVQTTLRTRSTSTTLHKEQTITQKRCGMQYKPCDRSDRKIVVSASRRCFFFFFASLGKAGFRCFLFKRGANSHLGLFVAWPQISSHRVRAVHDRETLQNFIFPIQLRSLLARTFVLDYYRCMGIDCTNAVTFCTRSCVHPCSHT
jgi:hypothetical protein